MKYPGPKIGQPPPFLTQSPKPGAEPLQTKVPGAEKSLLDDSYKAIAG